MVLFEMSTPHSYSKSKTHHRPLLHRLATMRNAGDRETDRAIEIGRLCYSIGGLVRRVTLETNKPVVTSTVRQINPPILHFILTCLRPSADG